MADDEVSELAKRLRDLKERAGRSFTGLAGRAALSRSSVHRYCSGAAVPPDFDTVSRLARACDAGRDELLELHRLWVLAGAAKPAPGKASAPAAPVEPPPPDPPPDLAPIDRPPRARRRWGRHLPDLAVAAIVVLLGLLALNVFTGVGWPDGPEAQLKAGTSQPSLFAATCTSMIRPGERGECVRQVQTLLTESGSTLTVDGNFGVETLRRVAAFQVLAGLPATGRVDDATKQALVSGRVSLRTWSADRVERRIREVFRTTGAGDEAVHVARCHSHLDALWVSLKADGSRGWGAFELTDDVLGRYDGTRRVALDPEWNIQAAHWIWAEHRDFREWPACAEPSASPRAALEDQLTDSAPRPGKSR